MKKTTDATLTISADYRQFSDELQARVTAARISAAQSQIKARAREQSVTDKKTHNFDLALPESLPQRGCILQPRVGPPTGLPWEAIHHPHNPIGVVSPNDRYATIIVCRLSPSGIFHQRPPTVSYGSDTTRRDACLFGRCFQGIGLPARDDRRRRRS